MKYTLEVPDQDADFVVEVLRRLAVVKLTPISREFDSKVGNHTTRDLLLKAREQLKRVVAEPQRSAISAEERARRFEAVAGSWQSEENGDELNQQLRAARYFRDRDVEL